MAANNRFKKSIDNATENTLGNITDNASENTADSINNSSPDNTKNTVLDNEKNKIIDGETDNMNDNITNKTNNDILAVILEDGKKNKGKNHSVYLSSDVSEALDKIVKQTRKTKSTVIDKILREVLIP